MAKVKFTVVTFHGGILNKESKFDKAVKFHKVSTIIEDPNGLLAGNKSSLYFNTRKSLKEGEEVMIELADYTIKKIEKVVNGTNMVLKVLTLKAA